MNILKKWMDAATAVEKGELANLAGTTVGTLNQIAGGYRTEGVASVRSGLAGRLEAASVKLAEANPKLPTLRRVDLSPECRGCDIAKRCQVDREG